MILEIIFRKWIFKVRAWICNIKNLFSYIENSYIFFFLNIRKNFSNILKIHLQFFFLVLKVSGFCQPWCDIFENIYDLRINQHLALLKSANLVDLYETLC